MAKKKNGRVTTNEVVKLLDRLTDDQAYAIGQVVDGSSGPYYRLTDELGYTREEAERICRYMRYGMK
jgi:hypothetical protein